jgi:phenylpropionate dioxygenase-like ring-hydroxylating dioxygenase large terminal subunit
MYPVEAPVAYPRSQWYVAGYGEEFTQKVFGRLILGDRIIFYRTADGAPVALSGRCVHRFMPLENAELKNDLVVCPYHGYSYGKTGQCQSIPTGGAISKHARLRRYPLVERGPLVWIWMGDPDKLQMERLPNPVEIGLGDGQSDWCVVIAKTFSMKARAGLLVDNLFDLSHLAFIHSQSLPGAGSLVMVPPKIETVDGRLRVSRVIPKMEFEPGSGLDRTIPVARQHGAVYCLLHTEMYNPCLIPSSGPWVYSLTADGQPDKLIASLNFVHIVTPETEHSTHYFGVVTRNYELDNDELSTIQMTQTDKVRAEDVICLEAIEQTIDGDESSRREISTKVDEGSIAARRILRNLIKSELEVA